jgi:hypothetical protein
MHNRIDNQEYEEPTLQGLAQRLEALERENERISSENAELRHEIAALRGPDTRRDEMVVPEFEGPVSMQQQQRLANSYFEANTILTHYLRALGDSGLRAVEAETTFDHNGVVLGRNYAQSGVGVEGRCHGSNGTGVYGQSPKVGVRGFGGNNYGDGGTGVQGDGDTGVWGVSRRSGWSGVYGQHPSHGYGVVGDGSGPYAGVLGRNPSGYGGRFEGGKAQLLLIPGTTAGKPTGAHAKGELHMDSGATLWVCVASGDPATWRRIDTSSN